MFDFNTTFETMMQSNNLDTVVLLAHMNPDGDAAGCVMGLAHYVHTVYPQYTVIPHLADTLDKGPKKLVAEDMIFNPYEKPSAEKYGVIVCDTATRERMIGYDLFENSVASIVIDHHASNEGYGDINVVKISEACSENLFYMLNWNMWKTSKVKNKNVENHPNAADYIYMGILHDTGCFSRAMESTLTASARLIGLGVEHKYVMKTMNNDTLDELKKRFSLFSMAKRAVYDKVAYVIIDSDAKRKYDIGYEDIHSISGYLRDCVDIELGFTMYEEEQNVWRCSLRSNSNWMNVNELLLPFGGGGHAAAAGLRVVTDKPTILLKDILQRISDIRVNLENE